MALSRERAKLASETLEDVYTSEGDAVVIARLYTFSDPEASLYGKGQCAQVSGRRHYAVWFPIIELTAQEDL